MPDYLVETYLARGLAGERASRERRARSAAEALSERGTYVRFDRSIYVPEDEICFFVFVAPSGRDAALAAERALLEPIRVVTATSSRPEDASDEPAEVDEGSGSSTCSRSQLTKGGGE